MHLISSMNLKKEMMITLTYYNFVIKLHGAVGANSREEAITKINGHLDDLGQVESRCKVHYEGYYGAEELYV